MDRRTGDDDSIGYNTEISYRRLEYHVQTEVLLDPDSVPLIHTLVFHAGALIDKVASACRDLTAGDDDREELRERVRRQHQEVLARIKSGAISGQRQP